MFLSKKKLSIDADGIPHTTGVYIFVDFNNQIVYIGSSNDIHYRVEGYIKKYYAILRNPMYCKEAQLMVKRLDEIERIIYEDFKSSDDYAAWERFRAREKELIIKYKPKYCGEHLAYTNKDKYYKEVKKVNKEIDEYFEYYLKAQKSFDEVMDSRFKKEVEK